MQWMQLEAERRARHDAEAFPSLNRRHVRKLCAVEETVQPLRDLRPAAATQACQAEQQTQDYTELQARHDAWKRSSTKPRGARADPGAR